jgi:folate-binding protein YgfZ
LCDRSHWGRIQLSGGDRLRFLHNQSTNNIQILKPGQSCDTVFVTSTARTIDLATAYLTEDTVLVLVSPNCRQKLMRLLDRYLFPADKVELEDITDSTATFSIIGPNSDSLLEKLGVTNLNFSESNSHQLINLNGIQLRIAVGSGLTTEGYTLIMPSDAAATVWQTLTNAGAVPLGENCWQQLRIEQGRPAPDYELTEDYNPLEAGLWQTISFDKGCYIGQETIARLNTYQGVKQQLWGIKLTAPVEPGTAVMVGEDKVGIITSYTNSSNGPLGLGYIRTKSGGLGLEVQVGDIAGVVVDVPFLSRGYLAEIAAEK